MCFCRNASLGGKINENYWRRGNSREPTLALRKLWAIMSKRLHCHPGKQGELFKVTGRFLGSTCRSVNGYFKESLGIFFLIPFLEKEDTEIWKVQHLAKLCIRQREGTTGFHVCGRLAGGSRGSWEFGSHDNHISSCSWKEGMMYSFMRIPPNSYMEGPIKLYTGKK